jgi:hypothetical protein
MALSGTSGIQEETTVFGGGWPRVYGVVDPLAAATEIYLGQVDDGALALDRQTASLYSPHFPQRLEISAPSQVNMKFTGRARELRLRLLHMVVGDERLDDSTKYVYPGASCAFADLDFNLYGERVACGGVTCVFKMHKARSSGAIEIGSTANDFISMPIEIDALDDSDGDYGGSDSSPLGWIWLSSDA